MAAEKRVEGIWIKEQRGGDKWLRTWQNIHLFSPTGKKREFKSNETDGNKNHLINKEKGVEAQQYPEGESVAKCNRDKQLNAGSVWGSG